MNEEKTVSASASERQALADIREFIKQREVYFPPEPSEVGSLAYGIRQILDRAEGTQEKTPLD